MYILFTVLIILQVFWRKGLRTISVLILIEDFYVGTPEQGAKFNLYKHISNLWIKCIIHLSNAIINVFHL